jgi:hypothetical protein
MQNVNQIKERILNIIREKGPSLPVQIARVINIAPMFSSVFLSELYEDSKLRMSHMKVGSSSLFLLPGQEAQLENFIEHLNQREKEAFFLIKKEFVLDDESQTPVIRVALRAIKDFAIPFKINISNKDKIFWKYHLLSDEEARTKLNYILNPLLPLPEKPKKIENIISSEQDKITNKLPLQESSDDNSLEEEKRAKSKKSKKASSFDFPDKLKEYLLSKEVEILESILEKKKEFAAKVRADTLFGKQEYYLIAKDKKKITETDLTLALQKAQSEKMPALIVSPGEIDKKAREYLRVWKNLVKFERIKF